MEEITIKVNKAANKIINDNNFNLLNDLLNGSIVKRK